MPSKFFFFHLGILIITWLIPAFLWWQKRKGKKIYFINLFIALSIVLLAGIILKVLSDNRAHSPGQFNLDGLKYAMIFLGFVIGFYVWGIVLTIVSFFVQKKEH